MTHLEHLDLSITLQIEAIDNWEKAQCAASATEYKHHMDEYDRLKSESWRHFYIHKRALTRMYNASMKRLERMGL